MTGFSLIIVGLVVACLLLLVALVFTAQVILEYCQLRAERLPRPTAGPLEKSLARSSSTLGSGKLEPDS